MKNETSFAVLNEGLTRAMNGLRTVDMSVFNKGESMNEANLYKLADMITDTFKIFFGDKYGNEKMHTITDDYEVSLLAVVTDTSTEETKRFELDVIRMLVNSASPSTLKGHNNLEKFLKWINSLDEFGALSIEFAITYDGVEFPTFEFRAAPNDYAFRSHDGTLFLVEAFVPINDQSACFIDTLTGDVEMLSFEQIGSALLSGGDVVIARGITALHSIGVEEYGQLINFLVDEYASFDDTDGKRVINDMMEHLCAECLHEDGTNTSAYMLFKGIFKDAPSDIDELVSDLMVHGGANGFCNIMALGDKHTDFESVLKKYDTLSTAQKGHVSIFINNAPNVIESCVTKYFGKPSENIGNFRLHYHNIIWGDTAPTTGRHTYSGRILLVQG